jgi:hypothetical protein
MDEEQKIKGANHHTYLLIEIVYFSNNKKKTVFNVKDSNI